MSNSVILGILIPFIGTTAGSACVFLMRGGLHLMVRKALLGFAGGVMVAASVWSLLIPAMDASSYLENWAFLPAAVGFLLGILFLLTLDKIVPHLHLDHEEPEGLKSTWKKTTMLVLAVTLHNIPEGMAVGVVFAGMLSQSHEITLSAAFALSIGIAIQNFPEGAIISLPLCAAGEKRGKAFLFGMLSGIVEPAAAIVTIALFSLISPTLPYLLGFAAGAMIYVVVEELIPESAEGQHSNVGTLGFAVGFVLMMILDVALG